jgi:hypothetical protein
MRIDPIAPPPRTERRTPAVRLREQLQSLAGGKARLLSHDERAWASVTFAGTRHRIELAFDGAEAVKAGETFIALLPEHEFAIPTQLVADAAVAAVDHRMSPAPRLAVTCELLLLEEG